MIPFKSWYLLLIYGQGSRWLDTVLSFDGTGRLARRIERLGDIEVQLATYDSFHNSAKTIKAQPENVGIMIGGTSLGGCNIGWYALATWRRPVEYAFAIQPSVWGERHDIPENVKECLCIYNAYNPITMGLGGRKLVPVADNTTTNMRYQTTWRPHPGDGFPEVQDQIIADIRRVTGKV